jgi:hypothetical protein
MSDSTGTNISDSVAVAVKAAADELATGSAVKAAADEPRGKATAAAYEPSTLEDSNLAPITPGVDKAAADDRLPEGVDATEEMDAESVPDHDEDDDADLGVFGFGLRSKVQALRLAEEDARRFMENAEEFEDPDLHLDSDCSVEDIAHWRESTADVRAPPSSSGWADGDDYNAMVELNPLARQHDRHAFEFCVLDYYGVVHQSSLPSPYLGLDRKQIRERQANSLAAYITYLRTGEMSPTILAASRESYPDPDAEESDFHCRLDNDVTDEELASVLYSQHVGGASAFASSDAVGPTSKAKQPHPATEELSPEQMVLKLQAQLAAERERNARRNAQLAQKNKDLHEAKTLLQRLTSSEPRATTSTKSRSKTDDPSKVKSSWLPKPPKVFANAEAFVSYHAKAMVSNGMDMEAAKAQAVQKLQRDFHALVEPHWLSSAQIIGCYKCGSSDHRKFHCPEKSVSCAYCHMDNHSVRVCIALHTFCFRCGVFGHKTRPENIACVENGMDQTWLQFKDTGRFTCSREFEPYPRWDDIAEQVKVKFGDYLSLVRDSLPDIAQYALYREGNRLCSPPWEWLQLKQLKAWRAKADANKAKRIAAAEESAKTNDDASVASSSKGSKRQHTDDDEVQILDDETQSLASTSKRGRSSSSGPPSGFPRGGPRGGSRGGRGAPVPHGRPRGQVNKGHGLGRGKSSGPSYKTKGGSSRGHFHQARGAFHQARGGFSQRGHALPAVQAPAAQARVGDDPYRWAVLGGLLGYATTGLPNSSAQNMPGKSFQKK